MRLRKVRVAPPALVVPLLLVMSVAEGADIAYEVPPIELSAPEVVPAEVLKSEHHEVADRVENDGYMNHYKITSEFGDFTAEGNAALRVRVKEIAAIAQLTEITRSKAFLDAMKKSATRQYRAAEAVIQDPKGTAKGVPGGVKRFVKRTSRQAHDLKEKGEEEYAEYKSEQAEKKAREAEKQAAIEAGEMEPEEDQTLTEEAQEFWEEDGEELAKKGAELGEGYALDWIGYSGARRQFARELGVDPYTDNPVLNKQLNRVSQAATAGKFTMKFVPVPRFDLLNYMKDANELVWKMDPLDLRMRNEEILYEMGMSEEAVEVLYDTKFQSPSLITVMVNALVELEGVEGRTDWVQAATAVASRVEAEYLVRAINFYAQYHQRKTPLKHLVTAHVYSRASTTNGHLIMAVPMDFLHWTEELADLVSERTGALVEEAGEGDLEAWIEGNVSESARRGLEEHGFEVHPRSFFGLDVDFGEG